MTLSVDERELSAILYEICLKAAKVGQLISLPHSWHESMNMEFAEILAGISLESLQILEFSIIAEPVGISEKTGKSNIESKEESKRE